MVNMVMIKLHGDLERVVIIGNWAAADDLHMLSHRCACADRQLLLSD